MSITYAKQEQSGKISQIVSDSNKDVAKRFGFTIENCPKHPSFCTKKWVDDDFERDVDYFIYEDKGESVGCVAFESPEENIAYLNRLSVLKNTRRKGIGKKLVDHIISYSKAKGIEKISIGIIADNIELKKWYGAIGFVEKDTAKFPHLPFDVTYMVYSLNN